jgi:RNA polymerase sigma factor (sigma-70 family)
VLRFAAVVTGDRALAEDLAQEVLIRAHARWRKIGSLDRPEYYVRKMILNEFLHWRRREWRLIPSGAGSDVDHRSAPDHALGYAERDALFAQLGKLPARQRAVLALRYYEGLCDIEIADLIGCKQGTVRAYASRALAAQVARPLAGVPGSQGLFHELAVVTFGQVVSASSIVGKMVRKYRARSSRAEGR